MKTHFIPSWAELVHYKKVKTINKFTGKTFQYVSSALILRLIANARTHGENVSFPEEWLSVKRISKQNYIIWYNLYVSGNNPQNRLRRLHERRGVRYIRMMKQPDLDSSVYVLLNGEEEDD